MSAHRNRGPHDGPGRHSIWGRVIDADSRPVPTAEVFWVDAAHAGADTVSLFDVHKVATADLAGQFWAPDLPPGPALLIADFSRLRIDGDRVRMTQALPVTLPAPDGDVTLRFPHSRTEFGSIHVVLRDKDDGRPAARLPIALYRADDPTRPLRQTETTPGGAVKFEWLREGKYRFCIFGTATHMEAERPIELRRNGRIDAQVGVPRRPPGPRTTVRVRVADRLGLPIAGAEVRLRVPSIHVPPERTDASGIAEFEDLPARPDAAFAAAPGHFPAGAVIPGPGSGGSRDESHTSDLRDGIDSGQAGADFVTAEVALEPSVRIRIFVLHADTARPVRNANLRVRHAGGEAIDWGTDLPRPDAPPLDFRDIEVRAGPVEIRAASPGLPPAETTLAVSPDDPTPVEIKLRLG